MSAFRASRTLLNLPRVPESPHKYHYTEGRTPFWRKVRALLSINTYVLPLTPARSPRVCRSRCWYAIKLSSRTATRRRRRVQRSRPPCRPRLPVRRTLLTPDIAKNLYYDRDFRRKYPQTSVVTQQHLTELLLAEPNPDGTKSLPESSSSTALTRPADLASPTAFTEVLQQVQVQAEHKYSPTNMPPSFPSKKSSAILKLQENAIPHNKHDYFQVYVYGFAHRQRQLCVNSP